MAEEIILSRKLIPLTSSGKSVVDAAVDTVLRWREPINWGAIFETQRRMRAALARYLVDMMKAMEVETGGWFDPGGWFVEKATAYVEYRLGDVLRKMESLADPDNKQEGRASAEALAGSLSARYEAFLFENDRLKRVQVAEMVLELLDTPLYIRHETREATLHTIDAIDAIADLNPAPA